MPEQLPEITPQELSDTIDVVLLITASDRDGSPFVMAYTDNAHMGSGEQQARSFLGNSSSGKANDYQRCTAIVRVKVPRDLMRERWTKAADA